MPNAKLLGSTAVASPSRIFGPASRTDIAIPAVTDLPKIEDGALGMTIPLPIEARLLQGNWYGNGPEIVLWHPTAALQAMVPLRYRATMLKLAIDALLVAVAEKEQASGA